MRESKKKALRPLRLLSCYVEIMCFHSLMDATEGRTSELRRVNSRTGCRDSN